MSSTIVLVHTQLSRNIGSVCRTMLNYGMTQLALLTPQCDPLDAECRALAKSAFWIAEQAQIYTSIDEIREHSAVLVALTRRRGKTRQLDGVLHEVVPKLKAIHPDWRTSTAFVFGPERTGLSNAILNQCDVFARLPTLEPHGSMNLAHAVTCVCYELMRDHSASLHLPDTTQAHSPQELAQQHQALLTTLTRYCDTLEMYTAAPRDVLLQRIDRTVRRSMLSSNDMHFLRKMLEQALHRYEKLSFSKDLSSSSENDTLS